MAKEPAGKKPATRKTVPSKPAAPVKKAAGKVTPVKPKVPAKKTSVGGATRKQVPKAAPKVKPKAPAKAPVKAPRKRVVVAVIKDSIESAQQMGLSPKEREFVDQYLVDLNGTQAAMRAKYSPHTARQIASQLLSKLNIQLAIADARKLQQERTQITADAMLLQAWQIATADMRELVETRVSCCRHCWGENHRYQRTVSEMNKAREQWLDDGKDPSQFEEEGGIGFNPHLQPHPDCTACVGDGYARDVIKDSRHLSAAAVQLYAGVKRTKDGLQVLTHSKEAFAEKLWKYLGLYEKDNQQKSDPLTALLNRISNGSANGFKPVQDDPEGKRESSGTNSLQPRQEVDDGPDD